MQFCFHVVFNKVANCCKKHATNNQKHVNNIQSNDSEALKRSMHCIAHTELFPHYRLVNDYLQMYKPFNMQYLQILEETA